MGNEQPADELHYIGVIFEITQHLFNFWQKNGYQPLYLQQNKLNTSNEKMILMLNVWENKIKKLNSNWLEPYENDFKTRFLALLSGPFRHLTPAIAISILDPKWNITKKQFDNRDQHGSTGVEANQKRIS